MNKQSAASVAFETLVDNFGEEIILQFFQELKDALDEIKEDFTPKQSGLKGWLYAKIKDENQVSYENTRLISLAEHLKTKADSLIGIYAPKLEKLMTVLDKIKQEAAPQLSCQASTELIRTYMNIAVQENLIRLDYFDTLIMNLKKVSDTLVVVIKQMQMQQDISELLNSLIVTKAINK